MPFRDEINIDTVEYSEKDISEGPAPQGENIETGKVIQLNLTNSKEKFEADIQFWRPLKGDVDIENPPESVAGYFAWKIEDQEGSYGVFDGSRCRIWLGLQTFQHRGEEYSALNIGEDWRDKIHWNDFVDRVYFRHLQYPLKQKSELKESNHEDLVSEVEAKSKVYEIDVEQGKTTDKVFIQLWRPKECQVVFVACLLKSNEKFRGSKGVFEQKYILTDFGSGISVKEKTMKKLKELADELRSELEFLEIIEE